MLYSFVLKLKLISKNQSQIKKYINYNDFFKVISNSKGISVSNFLTKEKEFFQGKIYYLRISSLDLLVTKDLLKELFYKKIERNSILLQNNEFLLIDIIHSSERSLNSKQMMEEDFINLENLTEVTLNFLTPTLFKIGDKFISEPDPELVFRSILKKIKNLVPYFRENSEFLKISPKIFSALKIKKSHIRIYKFYIENREYSGFTGIVTYEITNDNLENRGMIINCLSKAGFFSGVGYFSNLGLGQIRVIEANKE